MAINDWAIHDVVEKLNNPMLMNPELKVIGN